MPLRVSSGMHVLIKAVFLHPWAVAELPEKFYLAPF